MSALRRSISIPRNTPLAIVYTDVGGSTVASESLGERKAHRQIQRHNAIVRRACAAARGFELKLLGDGFQLAFPSVESALRFATEVQREFASRRARDGGLAVRIGVHVGVPILSRGEVGGRVAIIAQRVMSVARPGEVFVTADSVAGAGAMPGIRLVDRGAYRLKGIRESVLLCEVLWRGDDVAPACDQAGPGSQPSSAGPFVGRVFALFQLEDALTRAMNGRPVLVAVQGDAGIGKTQLVHEFSRRVGRRRVVFGGGCAYPGERRPFGVIVEALRSLAVSGLPVGWPASVRSLVAGSAKRAMRATGAAARVASRDPEDSRRHMLDAIVAALLEPRSEMATIVFLDDIHESDDDTLEVVRALGRRIAHGGVEARTLVILGFQPAEVARRPTLAELLRDLDRLEALDRVTLSGMTREEARTLLKAISAEAHHHTHFEALFDRSAGNPLFLRELARDLAERIQEQRSRRFESTPPGVDPPLRVQDVIGRRLARLRPPSLEVLRCAALLSPSFNATIVGAALQLDSESMLRALEDALEAGLLREALIDGSVVYTFEHRLVAEVLAAQLGLARRAQYHLALADALERINGTASPESVAQVAHHLIRAGREVPPARVVLHAEAAGDAARKVSALQSAVGFYSAAVEAIGRDAGQDGTREAALRTKLFEGLGHLGRVDEARFHADHVIAFFEGQGEKEAEARARMAIASLLASHAGYADAVAYLERAVEASRCGDPVLHGTVLARLCVALDQTGRPTDMRRMSRRLDAFAARTGRRDLAERALNVKRNWIQNYTNRFASLPDLTGRLAKSAAKRHDDWFSVIYQNEVGFFRFVVGDLTGAQRVATRTLRKAEERGRAAEILNARAVRALCACFRGDWVELDEEWSLAAPLLAEVRGALRIGLLLWARRRADLWLGRPFPQARSPAEIYAGMPSAALAVEASGCLIAVEHGSVNAGVRAGALSEVMPRTGRGLNWFIAVQALCASFGHLGDAEEAERWAVALSPFRDCFYLGFSRMALGRADALNGRWEQSIGHFDRAVATCRAQGLRPLLALALLERGRVYDLRGARGDAERARLSNEEGRRILEQLGMRGARCVAEVP